MTSYTTVEIDFPDCGEGDLCRVVYQSRLNVENENPEDVMQSIYLDSKPKNIKHEISGNIYLNTYTFALVHVIEGSRKNVEALLKLIEKDPRHREFRITKKETIESRRYDEISVIYGPEDNWAEIKRNLPSSNEWRHRPEYGVHQVDLLPIAGNFDLDLIRLTYHSWMKKSNPEKETETVEKTLQFARKFNQRNLIGGMLFYNTKTRDVYQALEGPENQVEALYKRIEKDTRHVEVELIKKEKVDKRRFKSWGMLWASEAESSAIMDNLPPGTVEAIRKKSHLSEVYAPGFATKRRKLDSEKKDEGQKENKES